MSTPRKTFLVEAGDTRFRVDLRRTSKGYRVDRVHRNAVPPPPPASAARGNVDHYFGAGARTPLDTSWISPLLKKGPRPAPEITVLTDRITVVVSEIPGDGAGAELEAQTISGLSSSEAVTATTRLPAEAGLVRCWTVQAAMRDVVALRSAVAGAKRGRLVSVGHPGGIRLDPRTPQLESWREFALFHGGSGDRIDLRGWNGPDAFVAALDDPEVASAPACVLRATRDADTGDTETLSLFDFRETNVPEAWSAALARACDPLTGRVLGMPLVSVPKPQPSSTSLAAGAIGISAAVVLLLGGHYWFTEWVQQGLRSEVVRLKEPAEKLASNRQRIAALQRELDELVKAEMDGAGVELVDVFAHRKRIGALLDGIARGGGVEKAVVLELEPDGLESVVTGAATTFNAPQVLAGQIDKALAAHGWRASLVKRTAKLLRADGGPWTYEIRLKPDRPVPINDGGDRRLFGVTENTASGPEAVDPAAAPKQLSNPGP